MKKDEVEYLPLICSWNLRENLKTYKARIWNEYNFTNTINESNIMFQYFRRNIL